ncbi:hypothetical protein B0H17DRAFT_1075718 [Mycena rosella]|uniref:Uncharacterized protein n=1 Tax=Mycena rosella TaxID=1033263 RepID=A0AAD7G9W7_MYCRO|nr:hypothetical protein B0H17DRAFT_1075718 [Mycena rosella]
MSTLMRGNLQCQDIFHPDGAAKFPRAAEILEAFSVALRTPVAAASYNMVILQIYAERVANVPESRPDQFRRYPQFDDIRKVLQMKPKVALVSDLQSPDGKRLWGCIPKDAKDISRYGDASILINADMAHALETTEPNTITHITALMLLCVTFAHERMHELHHHFFPEWRLDSENTPPGVEPMTSDGQGESGWALETALLGGQIGVLWSQEAAENGWFGKIHDITMLKPNNKAYLLFGDQLRSFVQDVKSGTIPRRLNARTVVAAEDRPSWLVSTRRPLPHRMTGPAIILRPGYVHSLVGNDHGLEIEDINWT